MEIVTTKMVYIINIGLALYFQKKLFNAFNATPKFSSCFDESFNRTSNKKQMDVHLTSKLVKTRYVVFQFLGTATTEETLETFEKVHENLTMPIT